MKGRWPSIVGLALCVVVGCWVRVQFVGLYGGHSRSYLEWADAHYFGSISRLYVDLAERLRDTHRYDTMLYPPGYSVWLAGLMVVGAPTLNALRLAQACVDACVVVVIFWLARALGLSRAAGLVGAGAYALHPLWASGSAFLLAEALSPALVVFTLAALVWADRGRTVYWVLPGVFIGLAVLVRPDLLLIVVPAAVFALVPFRPYAARSVATLAVGMALVLGAWGIHNRVAHASWTFTSTGGGTGLLEGLGDRPGPYGYLADDSVANHILMKVGLKWGTPEASRFLTAEYLRVVRADPVGAARTAAWRWRRILFSSEHLQPLVFGRLREWVDAAGCAVWLAAVVLMRRHRAALLVLAGPLFTALFGIGLVHYEPRYVRYVQLAYLFAALVCIERLWTWGSRDFPRATAAAVSACAVLGIVYTGVQLRQLRTVAQNAAFMQR
jgi:hypothetical protein